jgi:hypothetical protein
MLLLFLVVITVNVGVVLKLKGLSQALFHLHGSRRDIHSPFECSSSSHRHDGFGRELLFPAKLSKHNAWENDLHLVFIDLLFVAVSFQKLCLVCESKDLLSCLDDVEGYIVIHHAMPSELLDLPFLVD